MSFVGEIWDSLWGTKPPANDPAAEAAAKRAAEMDQARSALADKFKLTDDATPGARNGNEVSPEEFDRIAGMYADISNGHSDFKFDTAGMSKEEAAKFKTGTMDDMAKIMQTESGRELLGHLAYDANDKYDPEARRKMGDQAEGTAGHPLIHLGRSETEHKPECEHQQVSRDVYMDHNELGNTDNNSMGATSYVTFRPGETWDGKDVELRSDVNLYHELVHAMHNKQGDNARGAVSADAATDGGQKNAELQAVGLGNYADRYISENTYRAERREMGEDVGNRPTYMQ